MRCSLLYTHMYMNVSMCILMSLHIWMQMCLWCACLGGAIYVFVCGVFMYIYM